MAESIWVGQGRARGRPRAAAQGPRAAAALAPGGDRRHAAAALAHRRRGPAPRRLHRGRGDTSDVWLLDLEARRRARAPDHRPRAVALLGGQRAAAVARRRHRRLRRRRVTCGSCRPPAARRAGSSRATSRCGSTTRAWSSRSSATRTTRLAVVDVADPWPRRLASRTATSTRTATRARRPSRPTAREVAYTFTPRADLNRSEIRVAALAGGAVRALTGTPGMHDRAPGVVARRRDDRLRLRAQRLLRAPPRRRDGEDRQLTSAGRRPRRARPGTPTARACSPCAGGATASTS